MQIHKTYININPTILFDEIKEFILRHGVTLDQNIMETYSVPGDSSTFVYRGTLTIRMQNKEALRAHLIGTDRGETKLMLESNDELFPAETVKTLEDDLRFMLGSYEPKD